MSDILSMSDPLTLAPPVAPPAPDASRIQKAVQNLYVSKDPADRALANEYINTYHARLTEKHYADTGMERSPEYDAELRNVAFAHLGLKTPEQQSQADEQARVAQEGQNLGYMGAVGLQAQSGLLNMNAMIDASTGGNPLDSYAAVKKNDEILANARPSVQTVSNVAGTAGHVATMFNPITMTADLGSQYLQGTDSRLEHGATTAGALEGSAAQTGAMLIASKLPFGKLIPGMGQVPLANSVRQGVGATLGNIGAKTVVAGAEGAGQGLAYTGMTHAADAALGQNEAGSVGEDTAGFAATNAVLAALTHGASTRGMASQWKNKLGDARLAQDQHLGVNPNVARVWEQNPEVAAGMSRPGVRGEAGFTADSGATQDAIDAQRATEANAPGKAAFDARELARQGRGMTDIVNAEMANQRVSENEAAINARRQGMVESSRADAERIAAEEEAARPKPGSMTEEQAAEHRSAVAKEASDKGFEARLYNKRVAEDQGVKIAKAAFDDAVNSGNKDAIVSAKRDVDSAVAAAREFHKRLPPEAPDTRTFDEKAADISARHKAGVITSKQAVAERVALSRPEVSNAIPTQEINPQTSPAGRNAGGNSRRLRDNGVRVGEGSRIRSGESKLEAPTSQRAGEEGQGQNKSGSTQEPVEGRRDQVPQPEVKGKRQEAPRETLTVQRLREHLESLPIHKNTPGLTDSTMELVHARARAVGKSTDEWVASRLAGVETAKLPKNVSGAVEFLKDGRAVIRAAESADRSTTYHELMHVFEKDLTSGERTAAEAWLKPTKDAKGGWDESSKERFARAGERFAREGKAPNEQLRPVFEKFSNWMKEVYRTIKDKRLGANLTPEAESTFKRMFAEGESVPAKAEVKTEPKGEPAVSKTGHSLRQEDESARAETAAIREREGAPEVRAHAPLIEEAKANVKADPAKVHADLVDKYDSKKMFTDADQFHIEALKEHYAKTEGIQSANFQKIGQIDQTFASAEPARSLAARRDRFKSTEGRQLDAAARASMPPPRVARKMDALTTEIDALKKKRDILFQRNANSVEARALTLRIKKKEALLAEMRKRDAFRFKKDIAWFKKAGFDITDPNAAWLKDGRQFESFIGAYNIRNEGWPAVAREVYINLLHASGLVTGKKILADAGGLMTYAIQKHLEAGVAGVKRAAGKGGDSEASASELKVMWKQVIPGLARAGKAFWDTASTEQLPAHLLGPEDRLHFPAINNTFGKALRFVSVLTPVRMIDAFAKSMIAHLEVHSQAHRSAVDGAGKRLTGKAYEDHMNAEINAPDHVSASWEKAREEAMHRTYTNVALGAETLNKIKYGQTKTVGQAALKGVVNAALPFYGIPTNIVHKGLTEWTPGVSDLIAIGNHYKRGHTSPNEVNSEVAKAVMRLSAFSALGYLAASGSLTGEDDKTNPHTLKMFDKHFNYEHAGAPARAVAAAADYFSPFTKESKKLEQKEGAAYAEASRVTKGIYAMLSDQPVVHTVNDLWTASQRTDGGLRLAADKLALRPSIVAQAQNAEMEDVLARAYDKKAKAGERFLGYVKQRYTGNQGKPVQVDGKTLRKEAFDSGLSTFAYRLLSPVPLGYEER